METRSVTVDDIAIAYTDDADPEKAGQGLQSFPLIKRATGTASLDYWMMAPSEQVGLLFLLDQLRPKVAIEIGTRFGGSLQVLSRYCEKVYSLDIDPDVPRRLEGKYPNVEYLIGRSTETLPPLIERLQNEGAELSFALVDGDHSALGVKADIDNLLKFTPTVPLYIVMHDSFNPDCRRGLRDSNWADNPYVHAVELDFISGTMNPAPSFRYELWGGLALGILLPQKRTGRFEITSKSETTYSAAMMAFKLMSAPSKARQATKRAIKALLPRSVSTVVARFRRQSHVT